MLNPYTPGAGTRPRSLAGRQSQFALIESLAEQVEAGRPGNPLVVTGLRGVGKTSLLFEAAEVLRRRGWLAGYYEVRRDVGPGEAVRAIVAGSAGLTGGGLRRALSTGAHALGGLTLTAGPAGFGFEVVGRDQGRPPGDPYDDVVAFLRSLASAARREGVGVALLVDELQVFRKRDVSVLVQALSALSGEPVVLIGAGLPYLASELSKANTYAERFRYEQIDTLDDVDAREAVVAPAFEQGVVWDDDALDLVLDLAEGYPYFVQLYASETWVAAAGAVRLTVGHVRSAVPAVRRQLDAGLYAARYDRLSEREREYVDTMVLVADEDSPGAPTVGSGAVAARLGKTLPQLATTRDRVIRKGIVHAPAHGELAFSVPGFADHVRRRTGRA